VLTLVCFGDVFATICPFAPPLPQPSAGLGRMERGLRGARTGRTA